MPIKSLCHTWFQRMRSLVDRTDRLDLSIFQIGLRFIERCLINALTFRVSLSPYR
jgi:hypothetical protein